MRARSTPKHEVLLKWISTLFLPLVLLFVGHQLSNAVNERTIQAKFVELALDILKESPTQDRQQLRAWAAAVVDKYAGVRLSASVQASLISDQPVLRLEKDAPTSEDMSLPDVGVIDSLKAARKAELVWRCENQKSQMTYWTWRNLCGRLAGGQEAPAK